MKKGEIHAFWSSRRQNYYFYLVLAVSHYPRDYVKAQAYYWDDNKKRMTSRVVETNSRWLKTLDSHSRIGFPPCSNISNPLNPSHERALNGAK